MVEIKNEQDLFCYDSTMAHKKLVKDLGIKFANDLMERVVNHDNSKLEDPEFATFSKVTPKLAELTYGSEEYNSMLQQMQSALVHHYANNDHHPECYSNGIRDMNLLAIVEMFLDWFAATKRHNNGDIRKSIEINKKRFNLSDDISQIFINSIKLFDI